MIGAIVVTHGQLARELVTAAEMIVGDLPHVTSVSVGWHDDTTVIHTEIEKAIAKVQVGDGVLILTDMFGGTPSNVALTFLEKSRVEIITGVNLPMLLKLSQQEAGADLKSVAQAVLAQGKKNVTLASEVLHR
jgi:mannose PTS system EIIA component